MATIHHIDSETVRRASRSERPRPATAEIILFPGIRYERWVESRAMPRTTTRGRPKRDRLEIAD